MIAAKECKPQLSFDWQGRHCVASNQLGSLKTNQRKMKEDPRNFDIIIPMFYYAVSALPAALWPSSKEIL